MKIFQKRNSPEFVQSVERSTICETLYYYKSVSLKNIVGYKVFEGVTFSDQFDGTVFADQRDRRQGTPVVLRGLGQRIGSAIEQRENFARFDIAGQRSVIGQATFALDVAIDVAAVT